MLRYYDNPLTMISGDIVIFTHDFQYPETLSDSWRKMPSESLNPGLIHDNPMEAVSVYRTLTKLVHNELQNRLGEIKTLGISRRQILKYTKDQSHALHVDDQFRADPKIGKTKWVMHLLNQFGALVYQTSDDFQGGELIFPEQKLVITPKSNLVVMWPSNRNFPHEVLPVQQGTRIAYVLHFYVAR